MQEDNFVKKKVDAGSNATDPCTNVEDIFELQNIPVPGSRQGEKEKRQVASSCAICLEQYRPKDSIVWSANADCVHVFHEQCILLWLMKRFKPACPVCRQNFTKLTPDTLVSNEAVRNIATGSRRAAGTAAETSTVVENNITSNEENVETTEETEVREEDEES